MMNKIAYGTTAIFFAAAMALFPAERKLLAPDTPKSEIIRMNPSEIDPSLLPLDTMEELDTTGTPPKIDIEAWRLSVSGSKVRNSLSLTYEELSAMERISKKVILICPGFFVDYAEWEGVPLEDLLEAAKAEGGFKKVAFTSVDGYTSTFTREQVKNNLLFLALKVNGETLPLEHGFPARLVAEDILGGVWVKWVASIEVN